MVTGHPKGRRLDTLEEPTPENVVPDVEANYSAGHFGNFPFTPQWGLTDSSLSAFNQLSKNYDGALIQEKGLQDRLEELEEEKKEADQLNSSQADWIKQLEEANGEVFSLVLRKGFMDGISIGREDADVQAILKATPN
nr:hypothetical protein [Tanacetum cinerariifolium]